MVFSVRIAYVKLYPLQTQFVCPIKLGGNQWSKESPWNGGHQHHELEPGQPGSLRSLRGVRDIISLKNQFG